MTIHNLLQGRWYSVPVPNFLIFSLDKAANVDGYLVQKVTIKGEWESCDGKTKTTVNEVYWEAWRVKAQKNNDTGYDATNPFTDEASSLPLTKTKGHMTQSGEVKYFFATTTGNLGDPFANPPIPPDPQTGFIVTKKPPAGILPYTNNEPKWWGNKSDNGETDGMRSVAVTWNCCCDPQTKKLINPGTISVSPKKEVTTK